MVKVEAGCELSRPEKERISKLVEIAKKTIPNLSGFRTNTGVVLWIQIENDKIAVGTYKNQISVYSPRMLKTAVQLATAYEKSGEREFTVKKHYVPNLVV